MGQETAWSSGGNNLGQPETEINSRGLGCISQRLILRRNGRNLPININLSWSQIQNSERWVSSLPDNGRLSELLLSCPAIASSAVGIADKVLPLVEPDDCERPQPTVLWHGWFLIFLAARRHLLSVETKIDRELFDLFRP